MTEEEPRLHVVGTKAEPTEPRPAAASPVPRDRWITMVLAVALAVMVVLLAWTRTRMGAQISGLESQVQELRGIVAERNRTIDAHERRLDDVRDRVDGLRALLDQPVSGDR
jgi:hypothetical protein